MKHEIVLYILRFSNFIEAMFLSVVLNLDLQNWSVVCYLRTLLFTGTIKR